VAVAVDVGESEKGRVKVAVDDPTQRIAAAPEEAVGLCVRVLEGLAADMLARPRPLNSLPSPALATNWVRMRVGKFAEVQSLPRVT
jgi:hypothetical protein